MYARKSLTHEHQQISQALILNDSSFFQLKYGSTEGALKRLEELEYLLNHTVRR